MKAAISIVFAIGCSYTPSACPCPDATDEDAASPCPDVVSGDGPQDAPIDTPPDAFACTTHQECLAMQPGTCCVDPGPTGYCSTGIIIGGVCDPQ